jgi:undecaprenyl-diphosphatase
MFWNLAGATAWTLTFAPLGYLLGHNWAVIETIFRDIGYGGVALVVLGVVGFVLYRRRRERLADARVEAAEQAAEPSASPQEAPETTLVGGDSSR